MSNKAAYLNEIANRPEVLRAIAPGFGEVDLSGFFDDPENVMVPHPGGCALFMSRGGGIYEGHYLLTYDLRGAKAMRFLRSALDLIFTVHGAWVIVGDVATDNMAARSVTRALGFVPVGTIKDVAGRDCVSYRLEKSRWAELSARSEASSARTSRPRQSDTQPIRPARLH